MCIDGQQVKILHGRMRTLVYGTKWHVLECAGLRWLLLTCSLHSSLMHAANSAIGRCTTYMFMHGNTRIDLIMCTTRLGDVLGDSFSLVWLKAAKL